MEAPVKAVEELVEVVQQEASALKLHVADLKKAWDKLRVGNDGRRIAARHNEEEMEAVKAFEELVQVVEQAASALKLRVNEEMVQVVQQALSALDLSTADLTNSLEKLQVEREETRIRQLSVADLTNSLEEPKVEGEETRIRNEQEVGTLVASATNVQGQLKIWEAHAQKTEEELLEQTDVLQAQVQQMGEEQTNVLQAHVQQMGEELFEQANVLKAHVQQMGEKVHEQLEGPEAQLQQMREELLELTKETEDRSLLRAPC